MELTISPANVQSGITPVNYGHIFIGFLVLIMLIGSFVGCASVPKEGKYE